MVEIYADTNYWLAITVPGDDLTSAAERAQRAYSNAQIVTCDEVLVEFLTAVSGMGAYLRQKGVNIVRAALANPNVTVVPQTRQTFLDGLKLYEQRLDKGYSLVDCISMITMQQRQIQHALTADRHFHQEGFTTLMRNPHDP